MLNVPDASYLKRTALDDIMYRMIPTDLPLPYNMARRCIIALMQRNCVEKLSTAERNAISVMLQRTTLDDIMYHMIPTDDNIVLPLRTQILPYNMARKCIIALMQRNCAETLSTAERNAISVMLEALPNTY